MIFLDFARIFATRIRTMIWFREDRNNTDTTGSKHCSKRSPDLVVVEVVSDLVAQCLDQGFIKPHKQFFRIE